MWWIGNSSAASAMVKAASPTQDNSPMALLASLPLAAVGSQPWYEYVHTLQNFIADALSRDGYDCDVVREALASGCRVLPAEGLPWDELINLEFARTWELIAALA